MPEAAVFSEDPDRGHADGGVADKEIVVIFAGDFNDGQFIFEKFCRFVQQFVSGKGDTLAGLNHFESFVLNAQNGIQIASADDFIFEIFSPHLGVSGKTVIFHGKDQTDRVFRCSLLQDLTGGFNAGDHTDGVIVQHGFVKVGKDPHLFFAFSGDESCDHGQNALVTSAVTFDAAQRGIGTD